MLPKPAAAILGRFQTDFDRMFDNAVTEAEAEQAAYTRYLRDPHRDGLTLSFEEFRRDRAARGNREGQNHD